MDLDLDPDWDQGLPMEILEAVAGGCNELRAMRGVSQTWQAVFEASVKSIKVSRKGALLPSASSLALRFPGLTSLDIGESQIDEISIGGLSSLPRLASLTLGRPWGARGPVGPGRKAPLADRLTDVGLNGLQGLHLTSLNLAGLGSYTNAGLRNLKGMALTSLNLSHAHLITDAGLEYLQGMPLTHLDLTSCDGVNGEGFGFLQESPLASLMCEEIEDSSLCLLQPLPLTELSIRFCHRLSEGALRQLRGVPLTQLSLGYYERLEDTGLAHLKYLPLVRLSLVACNRVTGAGVEVLREDLEVRTYPHPARKFMPFPCYSGALRVCFETRGKNQVETYIWLPQFLPWPDLLDNWCCLSCCPAVLNYDSEGIIHSIPRIFSVCSIADS